MRDVFSEGCISPHPGIDDVAQPFSPGCPLPVNIRKMERCPSDSLPCGQGSIAIHSPAVGGESGFDLIFLPGAALTAFACPGLFAVARFAGSFFGNKKIRGFRLR